MNNLQLIEQVLYYIDEHISEPITFEHLAEQFGYSAFHFHRIFSTVTEQTITDYMKKRRLTLAHMQLCETEKTVTEIALANGFRFDEIFHFSESADNIISYLIAYVMYNSNINSAFLLLVIK